MKMKSGIVFVDVGCWMSDPQLVCDCKQRERGEREREREERNEIKKMMSHQSEVRASTLSASHRLKRLETTDD